MFWARFIVLVMSRPCSDYLDDVIKRDCRFKVLDHGFVRVVDYMGTDQAIVQAARVSYGAGTKNLRADEGLIRYLLRHRHTTPFEMCELKLHVKMPIFVARQWIRHRTANVNEYSGRYSVMSEEFYLPDETWLMDSLRRQKDELKKTDDLFAPQGVLATTAEQSQQNKQGRGALLSEKEAFAFLDKIRKASKASYRVYRKLLGDGSTTALARELARIVLPLNMYTEWYWKCDVHNLLHFLALRLHPHAQYEIRVYAEAIYQIMSGWLPMTAKAFADYRLEGVSLSKGQKEALQSLLKGETPDYEALGLSEREKDELGKQFML
ncbi:MAG: FAD-dependent thymidylate synthase [Alphaproteobacteria bacterium GM202ARS2]|nr:FAD-dependent thymidylate synthase [Alphaproteobacteria bacterium GM202ARS2]